MSRFLEKRKAKAIAKLQEQLQVGERQLLPDHDYAPTILIPTDRGEMVDAANYQLNRRVETTNKVLNDEHLAFVWELDHGEFETVENRGDKDFQGFLNGVAYIVPGRTSKQLPSVLAQHYRTKQSESDKAATYDKRTGAATHGQAVGRMPFEDFKREVQSYDGIEVDLGIRRKVY